MVTRTKMKQWLTRTQLHQSVTPGLHSSSGSSSDEECWTATNASWKTLRILLLLRKKSHQDGFLCSNPCCRHRAVKICRFYLLTSMELIPIPNCSILYFHSNNINSLESLFFKKNEKGYSYKYNCYKTTHK